MAGLKFDSAVMECIFEIFNHRHLHPAGLLPGMDPIRYCELRLHSNSDSNAYIAHLLVNCARKAR